MAKWNLIIYSPAYNVEKSVSELVQRVAKVKIELEKSGISLRSFIIVNDGSTDSTADTLKCLAKKCNFLVIVQKEKNKGPTAALFDGMAAALSIASKNRYSPEKTILVRMDSDLEHQPEDIGELIFPIIKGDRKLSVGYIPFDSRNGVIFKWFTKTIGRRESRRFLGEELPQFCPGFSALRGDIFSRLYPKLRKLAALFEKKYCKEMLTIDFILLAIASRSGDSSAVIELSPIEDKWIKKQPLGKLLIYFDYHRKTMQFLESHNEHS